MRGNDGRGKKKEEAKTAQEALDGVLSKKKMSATAKGSLRLDNIVGGGGQGKRRRVESAPG